MRAPRAVETTSMVVASDLKPSLFPWLLLLMAVVLGASAIAFIVGQRQDAPLAADVPTQSEPAPSTQSKEPAVVTAAPVEPEPPAASTPAEDTAPDEALDPDPAPTENPAAIYPETGAPDTYEAQLKLARRLKRGSRATAAYRRAIALNPEGADALAELGRLMLARQHTREATELAERATAIDPSNSLAWVTLGAARQMRGDRQGARQAYQSCAKLGRGRYVSECRAMLR
jgi:hypothetical protein